MNSVFYLAATSQIIQELKPKLPNVSMRPLVAKWPTINGIPYVPYRERCILYLQNPPGVNAIEFFLDNDMVCDNNKKISVFWRLKLPKYPCHQVLEFRFNGETIDVIFWLATGVTVHEKLAQSLRNRTYDLIDRIDNWCFYKMVQVARTFRQNRRSPYESDPVRCRVADLNCNSSFIETCASIIHAVFADPSLARSVENRKSILIRSDNSVHVTDDYFSAIDWRMFAGAT